MYCFKGRKGTRAAVLGTHLVDNLEWWTTYRQVQALPFYNFTSKEKNRLINK